MCLSSTKMRLRADPVLGIAGQRHAVVLQGQASRHASSTSLAPFLGMPVRYRSTMMLHLHRRDAAWYARLRLTVGDAHQKAMAIAARVRALLHQLVAGDRGGLGLAPEEGAGQSDSDCELLHCCNSEVTVPLGTSVGMGAAAGVPPLPA